MRKIATVLAVVVTLVSVGFGVVAQNSEAPGVFGYVRRVVLEPSVERPTRAQIWGTLSVAVPGTDQYQAPERGYVYIQLPRNSVAALSEILTLNQQVEAGDPRPNAVGRTTFFGITSFGGGGMNLRVRTADETPSRPDSYVAGRVVKVPYGDSFPVVQVLGKMPKPPSRHNYALVDKVVVEPNEERPERIQIWGTFAIGNEDGSFSAPQGGYLYFADPMGQRMLTSSSSWKQWRTVEGTGRMLLFHFFHGASGDVLRVRRADEPVENPYPYAQIATAAFPIRTDTSYKPIRLLLELRGN